jgi:hypothetical protein
MSLREMVIQTRPNSVFVVGDHLGATSERTNVDFRLRTKFTGSREGAKAIRCHGRENTDRFTR